MKPPALSAAALLLIAAALGSAAAQPLPNVNDCTFLRDPVDLRDCIDGVEGRRRGPPVNPSDEAPEVVPARKIAPRGAASRAAASGRSGRGAVQIDQVVGPRDRAAIAVEQATRGRASGAVSIDQIPPRARRKAQTIR